MKVQKILIVLAFFTKTIYVNAQQTAWLKLWQKDGTWVSIKMQERPQTIVNGEKIILKTLSQYFEYRLGDVQKFSFEDDVTSICDVTTNSKPAVGLDNGTVVVTDSKPHTIVLLYDMSGKVLAQYKTNDNGELLIYLPKQKTNAGMILKVGDVTYKIIAL